jgi:hypothetical protein
MAARWRPRGLCHRRAGNPARSKLGRASTSTAIEGLGVVGGTGVVRPSKLTGTAPMAGGGGLGAHARGEKGGLYGRLEAVEVVAWAPS